MTVSDLDKLFAINSISNNWPSFIFANGGFKKVSGIIVFDDGEEEILSPLQNTDVHSERTLTAQARITQRKLQHVRRMIDAKESNIQNRLEELMFDQWRNNPEIRMERRRLSILKAKATRLGNLLYTQTTI